MGENDLPQASGATRDQLVRRMTSLHIVRIGEMPRIQLYLDQVLSIVSGELAAIGLPDEPTLTGSMVNSYVKQRIVPAPTRKRYTRRHLASLLFVCAFKRVFSIAQVKALLDRLSEAGVDMGDTYDALVGAFERTVAALFSDAEPAQVVHGASVSLGGGDELDRLMSSAVLSLASKVYAEQMLAS